MQTVLFVAGGARPGKLAEKQGISMSGRGFFDFAHGLSCLGTREKEKGDRKTGGVWRTFNVVEGWTTSVLAFSDEGV